MSSFFIRFFELTHKRKSLFFILTACVLLVFAWFAWHLKLVEDISAMMPKDPRIDKVNRILQSSRFSDKLVVNIFLKDSTLAADPETLVAYSDSLTYALQSLKPTYISDIKNRVSEQAVFEVFSTVHENIPVFLQDEDYKRLDTLLSPENLDKQIANNYKTLISPASMVMKKFVLQDPLGMSGNILKNLQNLQVEDNFDLYNEHVVTKDKKHLLSFIVPANSPNETGKNAIFLAALDSTIASLDKSFEGKVEAQYFGAVAMASGNAERIKSDLTLTISIALTVLVIFMTLFFRRLEIVFVIFLPVLIGGIMSLGLLYFIKHEVSAIALGMGSVLLGITVDYSLHIFTHFRNTGSVKAVLKDLPSPLILSGLITASSFMCLMFVKSDALKDLGLFASISVICALLAGLTILPHFLRKEKSKKAKSVTNLSVIDRYTSYSFDRNNYLVILIIAVTIVSFFTASRVEFETDMMKMNYVSEKVYKAEKGLYEISNIANKAVYVVASGDDLQQALEAGEKIHKGLKNLTDSNLVLGISGVQDFLISHKLQEERIARWNAYWSPERIKQVEENLIEIGEKYKFSSAAFVPFLSSLKKEYQPANDSVIAPIRTLFFGDYISEKPDFTTIFTIVKVEDSQKSAVFAHIPESESITVLDRTYITSKFVELMRDDFNTLEVLSLGLVFLVLVISYGRIELGIIAFLPMLLSWIWTLGVMGILGIKFNIINIIISTFILGLGIDYSIFIMSGLMDGYAKGEKHLQSYKTSIFLSAFTSITGIGALIFADHPALKSIAALSIIGMCSVITISFTLQPLIFRKFITDRTAKGHPPYTAYSLLMTIIVYSNFLGGCLLMTVLANLVLPFIPISIKAKKTFFHYLLCKLSWFQIFFYRFYAPCNIINRTKENFDKPAIIISNHQSFLDILITIMLSPKVILMTKDWVWNSPIFGRVVKYADFIPASSGVEEGMELIEQKIRDGFSIVIFPEGTRSENGKINRFHKGAFYLAEQLKLDILPILVYNTGNAIAKGDIMLNRIPFALKYYDRVSPNNHSFGSTYQERAKQFRKFFAQEYEAFKTEIETPDFFKTAIVNNYTYKGPVLEWYCKVKFMLEKNYSLYNSLLPRNGQIVDIGCGYGFMAMSLGLVSSQRKVLGVDYDTEKIAVAQNGYLKPESVQFDSGDIRTYSLPYADAFVLSDVLHYIKPNEQKELVHRCIDLLNSGGVLLIREGNSEQQKEHKGTKLTEFLSTKFFSFNKTSTSLSFLSASGLDSWLKEKGFHMEIVDQGKRTSNTLFLCKKGA
jgi:1-acyl-sn-glycerol-3-phosphate acyltransferase